MGKKRKFPLGSFASCLQSIHRFSIPVTSSELRDEPLEYNILPSVQKTDLFISQSSADVRASTGSCERGVARVTTSEPQPTRKNRVKTSLVSNNVTYNTPRELITPRLLLIIAQNIEDVI